MVGKVFTQENFMQSILNDIFFNEQNTSFLNCKQKHVMKHGAPLDEFRVLHLLLPGSPWFHKQN